MRKYVKLLLLNDENAIKERIKQLKINFKFYVYNREKESVEQQTLTLEQNAIKKKKDIREKSLNEIEEQLYNQNLFLTDKAFDVYEELLIDCRKLFIELFNNLKISCDYTNFINIDEKIAELDNKLLLKNKSNFKDSKDEPAIIIYKKIIENTISKLDMSLRKHINIIKIYVRLFQTVDTANIKSKNKKTEIINKIINNYNLFANDEDKHTANDFYKILIELKSNFMSSKYNTLDSLDLKKLNISTNNVSWSFVILIIIFAIILLEPLIV